MSPQPDSRPGQLALHQSADNFTVPTQSVHRVLQSCSLKCRSAHTSASTAFPGMIAQMRYIKKYILRYI
ncbi:hypothetical protein ELI49_36345 [Rhizobium ruizarguesonis]|uniref:Uncharacterized protein n=1 Tax=Rhizobium ruizarguesonis TaxID=2081791 RepID=A0AAE8Q5S9_9HYPH|nr:hypothetical protein ELI56_37510 [Rhizobium ruizarguesonis]TAT71736.1 hypothetical protein ELI52_34875 [Rhizobium ruizarguesonis]TAT72557.1 hypothetical protein ELI54_37555 [Rhizobium ruizarguesonis]TAT91780.1 hypothetical protein ELI53_36550 [Rhizobium ruizarguesonis]TAT92327.1 hypothetical protein ELI55_36400 [Rhizobium ruizarguesonis]